jgi:hypothetical protein
MWYHRGSMDSIARLEHSKCQVKSQKHAVPMPQLAAAMSPEDSYPYYYNLADQQHQVHLSRADVDAFVYAMERFPSLYHVTISARAHGRLFMPRYETPMIRAFPLWLRVSSPSAQGFRYKYRFLVGSQGVFCDT